MRVLAIGNMYPPHHMGGYEIVWHGAMRHAESRGHTVRILTSDHREQDVDGADDGDVHRELALYWSWSAHEWRPLSPLQRWRHERANTRILKRHVTEFRPEVISFWAMGALSLSLVERFRSKGPPSILVVHDDWLVYGPKRDAWMRLWSGRRSTLAPLAQAMTGIPTRFARDRRERVLPNSEFILRRALEQGYVIPNARVVTPGISPQLAPIDRERPWGWRLLCVGRLDRQKGTDVAISAMSELPDATLEIVGSGDAGYQRELADQIERLELSDRVRILGQLGQAALADRYANADAVVFPVRWEEPFGLVPLEAMAAGKPVVATARGGAAEYLRDEENALVVPADDPSAVARAVIRLCADQDLRRRLRSSGLTTAAAHTAPAFDERIVDELELAAYPR
jgi:glycogen(starch) synthase